MGLPEGVATNSLFLCLKEGATARAITKVSSSCLQPPWCVLYPPCLAPSVYTPCIKGQGYHRALCVLLCTASNYVSWHTQGHFSVIASSQGFGQHGSLGGRASWIILPNPAHGPAPQGTLRLVPVCSAGMLLKFAVPAGAPPITLVGRRMYSECWQKRRGTLLPVSLWVSRVLLRRLRCLSPSYTSKDIPTLLLSLVLSLSLLVPDGHLRAFPLGSLVGSCGCGQMTD